MTHSLIKSLCQVKLETNNPTNDWKWEDPGGFQWLFKQVIMNYKKEKTSPALETKKSEYILFKKKKKTQKEHLQFTTGGKLSFFLWFKSFENFLIS